MSQGACIANVDYVSDTMAETQGYIVSILCACGPVGQGCPGASVYVKQQVFERHRIPIPVARPNQKGKRVATVLTQGRGSCALLGLLSLCK